MADRLKFADPELFPPVFAQADFKSVTRAVKMMRGDLAGRPDSPRTNTGSTCAPPSAFSGTASVGVLTKATSATRTASASALLWTRPTHTSPRGSAGTGSKARQQPKTPTPRVWVGRMETGKGWRPPYEALGMTVPETAGRPTPGDAERAATTARNPTREQ